MPFMLKGAFFILFFYFLYNDCRITSMAYLPIVRHFLYWKQSVIVYLCYYKGWGKYVPKSDPAPGPMFSRSCVTLGLQAQCTVSILMKSLITCIIHLRGGANEILHLGGFKGL